MSRKTYLQFSEAIASKIPISEDLGFADVLNKVSGWLRAAERIAVSAKKITVSCVEYHNSKKLNEMLRESVSDEKREAALNEDKILRKAQADFEQIGSQIDEQLKKISDIKREYIEEEMKTLSDAKIAKRKAEHKLEAAKLQQRIGVEQVAIEARKKLRESCKASMDIIDKQLSEITLLTRDERDQITEMRRQLEWYYIKNINI